MNLIPFVELIENAGYGEQGKTLFVNHMPSDVKNAVLLRERLIGGQIDHYKPGMVRFQFQVIVRTDSYATGDENAKAIAKLLKLVDYEFSSTLFVHYCRPMNVPVPYPLSDGELVEFNISFDVCVVDSEWE